MVLVLSLKNIGMDVAPGVMGILSSDNPYITVVDSIGSFGLMEHQQYSRKYGQFLHRTCQFLMSNGLSC